ncbi:WbqC family protein [Bacteroidota bacterium]
MKLGIMQPYFFPYIGYFQLINAVDKFVIYDNIKFSKRGWIQRNRILSEGKGILFSLPLKKDSDYLDINERKLADSFAEERKKILRKMENAYIHAPHYLTVFPIIEKCFLFNDTNLFNFIEFSIKEILRFLEIKTEILISSCINVDRKILGKKKVISICKECKATEYINAIGGQNLYSKKEFKRAGITLNFLKTKDFTYNQLNNQFVNNLSIIDVMMFNNKDRIKELLNYYILI